MLLALCKGNTPVTGGFPSQRASNAENISIWLGHNDCNEIRCRAPWHLISKNSWQVCNEIRHIASESLSRETGAILRPKQNGWHFADSMVRCLSLNENLCILIDKLFLRSQLTIPLSLWYKMHLSRQLNCWSLRCSWGITCWRCSNYIFILALTPGFNILHKDNCKPRREAFKFWDLVHLILY